MITQTVSSFAPENKTLSGLNRILKAAPMDGLKVGDSLTVVERNGEYACEAVVVAEDSAFVYVDVIWSTKVFLDNPELEDHFSYVEEFELWSSSKQTKALSDTEFNHLLQGISQITFFHL